MGIVGFALLPHGRSGREKKGLELMDGPSPPYMLEEGPRAWSNGGGKGIEVSSPKLGGVLMHGPCARMTRFC